VKGSAILASLFLWTPSNASLTPSAINSWILLRQLASKRFRGFPAEVVEVRRFSPVREIGPVLERTELQEMLLWEGVGPSTSALALKPEIPEGVHLNF
jgi:hypothetical protein